MPTIEELIIQQIPMEAVFKEFGVSVYRSKNGTLFGDCPFCNQKRCVIINEKENLYHCIACGSKGNVIDFTRRFMLVRLPDAIQFLAEKFNISDRYSDDQDHLRSPEDAAKSWPQEGR